MWGALSRLFVKNENPSASVAGETNEPMDKQASHQDMDTLESKQARQRASVKWILSKAFNNRVPENLKEPFYRDHEGQEHLKPQIVVGLGNASLYCQTLSNLYSDPNYQSLNHWSILQTLTRKGVPLGEATEQPLTETVLIQTNPLRINAHMYVIEALMILYAKEVAASERVSSAIGRISGGALPKDSQHHESSLLYWISHACAALKKRIDQEIESGATDENGVRLQSPDVPPIRDYRDLCDGVCLAFLIADYCPKVVPWTTVRVNYLPTVEDSIYNVLLVSNFSQKHLPYSVFHKTPQDITYMRGSMKQNLVVLLADFFNLFEIHPTKCVCYPGMDQSTDSDKYNGTIEHGIAHRRGLTCQPVTPIPDLRSGLDSPTQLPSTKPPFQVTRSTSATTMRKPTPPREVPEHFGPEEGDMATAGRPSNWEDARRTSYAGRRSRRNSFTEDSQLTIENFGGSQDQLNMIGRTIERERKFSNSTLNNHAEPAVAVRSSIADARGTLQIGYENDSESEKQDRETEKTGTMRRQPSMDNVSHRNVTHSKEIDMIDGDVTQSNRQQIPSSVEDDTSKRKKSFVNVPAANPNTTTWQQQSMNFQQIDNDVDEDRSHIDDSKLSAIRMKLEEHRRHILQEKRKMEFALSRQQQKVGKAAFFQAINKGKAHNQTDNDENKDCSSSTSSNDVDKSEKPCSLQDLPDITDTRWEQQSDSKKTPDLDPSEIDQYQQSIAIMNSNLKDIQQDIHRLTNQQSQMQAQAIQAQQLLQAQQIANMIQYHGSSQNIPQQYRNVPPSNFGSTPHLNQPYNQQSMIMRPLSRDPQHQYINDQGQYITNSRECSPFMNDNGQYYGNQYTNAYPDVNQYQTYRVEQPQYREYESPPPAQPSQNQFYLHDNPPQPPPRRTWAQQAPANNQQMPLDTNAWTQNSPKIDTRTWKSPSQPTTNQQGFMLHQNGNDYDRNEQSYDSPQHSRVHRQISQIISGDPKTHIDSNRQPISPPIDDMAPQSISFIGDEDSVDPPIGNGQSRPHSIFQRPNITSVEAHEQDLDLGRLNITSGKLTYRIPSPTRPSLNMNSFQDPNEEAVNEQKGFYIAFDNDQPKRPKPPLRKNRSPKKERSIDSDKQDQSEQLGRELNQERRNQDAKRNSSFSAFDHDSKINNHRYDDESISSNTFKKPEPVARRQHVSDNQVSAILDRRHLEDVTNHRQTFGGNTEQKALIIDDELKNLDPESVDEMERKKEKIMLLSLQRRQQQEEAKARKEIEAMQRREKEREKEDERVRKRDEQAARRALILEQHKYKKAIEEAEQKGTSIDRNDFALIKQQMSPASPKMRQQKSVSRPRPKTICVERGSMDQGEGTSLSSRDKKGSNTNLTGLGRQLSSNSIRRDYYRGSTDSLAIRESPDEYPSTSSTPIGRRGSYKASRVEQPQTNGIDTAEDENNISRPADIEADMREMEGRKRVEEMLQSRLFREELERIVDSHGREGASGLLQQLSDMVGVPAARVGSVFKSSNCVLPINDIRGVEAMGYAKGEKILRCKMAATFRLLDLYGWTQCLGAQVTARLNEDQEMFLVNPSGLLSHEVTASSLNKVDMQGNVVQYGRTNFGINTRHYMLHSAVHAARPDIRCAIYVGCNSVVAVSSLKAGLLPLTHDAAVLGEVALHRYTGALQEPEEREKLIHSLGPLSKVLLLTNHGALCCGETVEEAYYAAYHIVQACETQLKMLPVGLDNLNLIPEEARKAIYDASRKPPEGYETKANQISDNNKDSVRSQSNKWRVGGAEYEALMRMLDNAGFRTGYIYRSPLVKSELPKPRNDVEVPPAVSSLGYLLEEEELYRQGIWKKSLLGKGGDRSRWLNSPNVYQKVEVLETGTQDPKKITKWVADGSPTHSTAVRIEHPLQFVPHGTNPKEFKKLQQLIKDNRRADKISAGPQSHILEGVTWDEASRIKDANVSGASDHVVLMGAASKGIIQRGYQHNATVYKAPYAKNPFDSVTDDELNDYKKTIERKRHGDYTDTDFSESEGLSSLQISAPAKLGIRQTEQSEHQVHRIETKQAPKPSQPEVVLSDANIDFISMERVHSGKPPTGRGEHVQNGDHSDAHVCTFSHSSKEDVSTEGSPKKDKKKKKGLRTPSFLKKKKEKKKVDA